MHKRIVCEEDGGSHVRKQEAGLSGTAIPTTSVGVLSLAWTAAYERVVHACQESQCCRTPSL